MSSPEAKAREIIDAKLTAAGWDVQDVIGIDLTRPTPTCVRPIQSAARSLSAAVDWGSMTKRWVRTLRRGLPQTTSTHI